MLTKITRTLATPLEASRWHLSEKGADPPRSNLVLNTEIRKFMGVICFRGAISLKNKPSLDLKEASLEVRTMLAQRLARSLETHKSTFRLNYNIKLFHIVRTS